MKFFLIYIAILHSLYAQPNDIKEFFNGQRLMYSSKNEPKAKGIELSFEYPTSWNGLNGKRPNVLYQVTSNGGKGLEICNIVIKNIDFQNGYVLTEQDKEELISLNSLKENLPKDSIFLQGGKTKIEGIYTGWVRFLNKYERADSKLLSIWQSYYMIYNQKLIIFGCSIADGEFTPKEKLIEKFDTFHPLFQEMANSIIIYNKWR